MSEFKLTTVEEFEAATARLLETGAKVGADSWQMRVKNQTPHCKFGEQGVCCRICSMGPCRITPKAPRGICGCDVHGIVGRNFLRFTAGGAATHSDHGREICITLGHALPSVSHNVHYTKIHILKIRTFPSRRSLRSGGPDDLGCGILIFGTGNVSSPF